MCMRRLPTPCLLRGAPDLADHDDALRLRVVHELLQTVHEVRAVEGVAADAHHRGLPQAMAAQKHQFIVWGL
jgi:hypothetical protein